MSDNAIRPTFDARQFYDRAERQAYKQAREIDPPEGDPQAVRAAVDAQRRKLLRQSLKREADEAGHMAKQMMKAHRQAEKDADEADKRLAKARTMATAYPQDSEIERTRAKAWRERAKLRRKAGGAFQAAAEWEEYGKRLTRLIETGIDQPARTVAGLVAQMEREARP